LAALRARPDCVLAHLVGWVIPGKGQTSSIAENIAGNKHDAWSG